MMQHHDKPECTIAINGMPARLERRNGRERPALIGASLIVLSLLGAMPSCWAAGVDLPLSPPAPPSGDSTRRAPVKEANQTDLLPLLEHYLTSPGGSKLAGNVAALLAKGE